MSEVIRAICPHCERPMRVKRDGTLGHHGDPNGNRNGLPWSPRCPGAGWTVMTPEQVSAEVAGDE